jgi:hypothetical protein
MAGDTDRLIDEIEEFLTGSRSSNGETDRVLTTVIFTISSTRQGGVPRSATGNGVRCSTATTRR